MWNIAHNLGGFLAPVIVGKRLDYGSCNSNRCCSCLRWGMFTPDLFTRKLKGQQQIERGMATHLVTKFLTLLLCV
jgi:hypothetical protein